MTTATLDNDIVCDGLMSIPEAAEFLRVSRSAIYSAMDRGDLAYTRLPGQRSRRIPKRSVIAFAAAGLTAVENPGVAGREHPRAA